MTRRFKQIVKVVCFINVHYDLFDTLKFYANENHACSFLDFRSSEISEYSTHTRAIFCQPKGFFVELFGAISELACTRKIEMMVAYATPEEDEIQNCHYFPIPDYRNREGKKLNFFVPSPPPSHHDIYRHGACLATGLRFRKSRASQS